MNYINIKKDYNVFPMSSSFYVIKLKKKYTDVVKLAKIYREECECKNYILKYNCIR